MNRRLAHVLRALTFAVFAAAAVVAWRTFDTPDAVVMPELDAGEVTVDRAIDVAGTAPLEVRGYVFDGPGGLGLRLCNGYRSANPPRCFGPFLDLDHVDRGFFDLSEAEVEAGRYYFSTTPVTLRGTIVGTRMTVEQILS